jgi:tRNA pseudouridine55 synthase
MAKRKSGLDLNGILLLDKATGVSSNHALQQVRRLFNANKAGHTGSLDPLATGLLPLCFGEATKVSGMMLDDDKRYLVSIRLGTMTDTGDLEGQIINEMAVPVLSQTLIESAITQFLGPIDQVPPMYSALKHQGKKLYELARQGQIIERPARPVTIHAIQLLGFDAGTLELDVSCSKGTYIRSLAEDLSHALGTCGTVSRLRRTEAGCFTLAEAITLDDLLTLSEAGRFERLLPVDLPLQHLPVITLEQPEAQAIQQGQTVSVKSAVIGSVRIYANQCFLGLGELSINGKLAPKRIFNLGEHCYSDC